MAITIADLLKPERLRPAHLQDGIDFLSGETEDTFAGCDLTAEKTNTTAAQNNTVDAFQTAVEALIDATSLSEPDKTSLKAAIDWAGLKTDLETDLDNEIADSETYLLSDALTQVKAVLVAQIATEYNGGTNYPDPRCQGIGRYPESNDDPAASSTPKHCISCDGLGRTTAANTPSTTVWAETTEFDL